MKLDRTKPYGIVTGHDVARFEQNGTLFNGRGEPVVDETLLTLPERKSSVDVDKIIETDAVESGRLFLLNVLKGGPLSKSAIYKVAEDNNQSWDVITKAAALMGVVKFSYNRATMWKLPEELGVL